MALAEKLRLKLKAKPFLGLKPNEESFITMFVIAFQILSVLHYPLSLVQFLKQ